MPPKKAAKKKAVGAKAAIKSIIKKTQKAKAVSEKAEKKSKVQDKIQAAKKATAALAKKADTKPSKKEDGKTKKHKSVHKKQMKSPRDKMHIFLPQKKNYGIGRELRPRTDLRRFVRWPLYIRRQRKKMILMRRLKVPPAINQFKYTLDGITKKILFRLIRKYKPESPEKRRERLKQWAIKRLNNPHTPPPAKILKVQVGLRRVTPLIERKQAKLVIIASNVEPIEMVVWMPALCKKLEVPFCIVKNDSCLGRLVGLKHCTCVAFTDIKSVDQPKLEKIIKAVNIRYGAKFEEARKKWGGLELSRRTKRKIKLREAAILAAKGKAAGAKAAPAKPGAKAGAAPAKPAKAAKAAKSK